VSAGTVEDEDQPDLDPIMPNVRTLDIEGIQARVIPLRLREVFGIARIIGVGLGAGLFDLDINWDDPEELKGAAGVLLLLALPNAEDECVAFLRSIVKPVDKDNEGRLRATMANPKPGVVFDILDLVLDQEGDDLGSLLGKARRMGPKMAKLMPETTGPAALGPGPSTSSPPSTGGGTKKSSRARSAA
jgi:hypothetical protein